MKKILILSISLLLLFNLCACQQTEDSKDNNQLETDAFTEEKEEADIETKIEDVSLYQVYYNANSERFLEGFGSSSLELKEDGTFVFTEIEGMGATMTTGTFSVEGDMVECRELTGDILYDSDNVEVSYFAFVCHDPGILILNHDLTNSKAGDYFTLNGEMPLE